jgi:Flp pilus assembly protein CpaB
MASTVPPASRPAPSGPARAGAGLPISEPRPHRQRRRPVLLAGAAMVLVGALATAGLVSRAGHRIDVLAVAHDVPVGQRLTAADLRVASIPSDPALRPVSAGRLHEIVGQVAAVDLRAGTLLTGSEVARQASATSGKQIVGIRVDRGGMPLGTLQPGDEVLAVTVPGKTGTGAAASGSQGDAPTPIPAVVLSVGDPATDGSILVNLAVGPTDGTVLATRAAAGDVALVQQPRQQDGR